MNIKLSPRLQETLSYVVKAYTNEAISANMDISLTSVEKNIQRLKDIFKDEVELQDQFISPSKALIIIGQRYFQQMDKNEEYQDATIFKQMLAASKAPTKRLPQGSRMTIARNKLFTGRDEYLQRIARHFNQSKNNNDGCVIITGVAGIGKTQLAGEFAYRYGYYFQGGVFWINMSNSSQIISEIAECGGSGHMNLQRDYHKLSLSEKIQLVQSAWKNGRPKLLIFDNCDREDLLRQWYLSSPGCYILITSRHSNWDPIFGANILTLRQFNREETVHLLGKYAPLLHRTHQGRQGLQIIANYLGDFPLATRLAGKFLSDQQITNIHDLQQYISQLNADLLMHPSMEDTSFENNKSIFQTFMISYKKLDINRDIDSLSKQISEYLPFFSPNHPIPHDILRTVVGISSDASHDILRFKRALDRLTDLGIIENDGMIRIHQIIIQFLQLIHNPSDTVNAKEAVTRVMMDVLKQWRKDRFSSLTIPQELLQPHVEVAINYALDKGDKEAATQSNNFANWLHYQGRFEDATIYYEKSIEILSTLNDDSSLKLAETFHNLANTLQERGHYDRSLSLLRKALNIFQIQKDVDGSANCLASIGILYHVQKDFKEAEEYYIRALNLRMQHLSSDHPDIAWSLNNLGELYKDQALWDKALSQYEEAYRIHSENPDVVFTAIIGYNAGEVLKNLGRYRLAKRYFKNALRIWTKVLGKNHEYTKMAQKSIRELIQGV